MSDAEERAREWAEEAENRNHFANMEEGIEAYLAGYAEAAERAAQVADERAKLAKNHSAYPSFCLNAVEETARVLAEKIRGLAPRKETP